MLDVPYTVCNIRLVVNSAANVVAPAIKTVMTSGAITPEHDQGNQVDRQQGPHRFGKACPYFQKSIRAVDHRP